MSSLVPPRDSSTAGSRNRPWSDLAPLALEIVMARDLATVRHAIDEHLAGSDLDIETRRDVVLCASEAVANRSGVRAISSPLPSFKMVWNLLSAGAIS